MGADSGFNLNAGEPGQNVYPSTQIFAGILDGYSDALSRTHLTNASDASSLGGLLDRFGEINKRVRASTTRQSTEHHQLFERLLTDHGAALEEYRRQQEDLADEFNLLEVMQLTQKEIRHSMVLAWLLDHDMRRLGTHAQGPLGFRLFLEELRLPVKYADCPYWVRREVAGDESIVDIEVACRGQFLIHIENKIWSGEGIDQTNREWADFRKRAFSLGIDPEDNNPPIHALFLTPHGISASNPNFQSIAWGRIVRVLDQFSDDSKPQDVKLFAAHYARSLRRFITTSDTKDESEYGN